MINVEKELWWRVACLQNKVHPCAGGQHEPLASFKFCSSVAGRFLLNEDTRFRLVLQDRGELKAGGCKALRSIRSSKVALLLFSCSLNRALKRVEELIDHCMVLLAQ